MLGEIPRSRLHLPALLATALAGPPAPAAPPEATVEVRMFQFQPDTLHVPAGTRVVWHNQDEIPHAVTGGTPERPEPWAGGEMAERGATTALHFEHAGIFVYHCGRHPSMRGVVRVTRTAEEP